MSAPIRLVPERVAPAMEYEDAKAAFRVEYRVAKLALADAMAKPASLNLRKMLDGSAITIRDLREMRRVATEWTEKVQAMAAALDACIDVAERAERGRVR